MTGHIQQQPFVTAKKKMTNTMLASLSLLLLIQCAQAMLYNTSSSCFKGTGRKEQIHATCDHNTTTEVGIIAVRRLFYGVKPKSNQCQSTDDASVCCEHKKTDCVLVSAAGQLPEGTMTGCSGQAECLIQAKKKFTGSCPYASKFPSFTTYGHMEYECINEGLLTDMCHAGIIESNKILYISSNIYHINDEHQDKSCSCSVTTNCGETIDVEAVDIRLHRTPSSCTENLVILDNKNTTHNNTITCYNTGLNGFINIFTSKSNSLTLNMTINGNHTGRVWIKLKGTSPNTTVNLKCGALSTDPDHFCPGDMTTPPITTPPMTTQPVTTPATSATTPTTTIKKCGSQENCGEPAAPGAQQEQLSTGAIIGIILAGVFILLVIILILVLIFRRNTPPDPDDDYTTPTYTPDYETLRNYVPHERAMAAYDNQVYLHDKMESQETNHDYAELQAKMEPGACNYDNAAMQYQPPEYDNHQDDSVMEMPKGAVG
ncbi:uncharacterized protein [Haliotis asinina]|uniref:uncharacterized protein n=1 Tax=Haliotis asinina TaxID=109174 RepID=UPI003532730F